MSANNWRKCPKCKQIILDKWKSDKQLLEMDYGKIPSDEYIKRNKELNNEPVREYTLREDFNIGIDEDGNFSLSYKAGCEVCGFHFDIKKTEMLLKENNNGSINGRK